jgi:putative DNA primase/helicase
VLEASPNGAGKFSPLSAGEIEAARKINGAGPPRDDGAVCLMPVPSDAPRAPHPRGAVATWQYNDANGQQLYRVHRFDDPSGKRFSWQTAWRLRGGVVVWRWKGPDGPRPIYGLDRLAARQDAPVVVAEGEKASDAAQRIFPELVAVTSPGGAEAPAKADWDVLAGRRVLLWPDADEPGARYVATVASRLQGVASEIKILDAKALASINPAGGEREPVEGWDAADAEIEWKDKGELRRALKSLTRTYESTGEGGVSRANEAHSPKHWPVPKALPSGLLAVPQFDLAFLPNSVAPWVADIADRMQCPLEYVAVPAIVALGAALGRKVAIRPQRRTDWLETPNLWGCVVGRPGAMKSPAATEALKPLVRLETNARTEYEASLKAFAKEDALAKIRKDEAGKAARAAIKSGGDALAAFDIEEPEEPKAKRFLVNDTSYEALGEILADNPNGVLAFRDELVSLLKTLDREEYAATRGFFLTAWNGTSGYTFDRIVRGRKHIDAACLSLLGGTQPGRIAEYMRRAVSGGAGDDGLIQRFGLLVWPDQSPEWKEVDRFPDSDARHAAHRAFEAFEGSSPESFCATRDEYDALPYLRFDDAAQEVFAEWRADLERRLRGGDLSPALESHLSKYRKLVPALALINHLADGGVGSVSEAATLRALALAEYLEAHARRAYAAGSEAEAATAKAILARVRKGELADGFTLRDVHQKGWANLTDRDQVKGGLDLLVDLDWLAAKIEHTGGRPRTVYTINPGALA